MMFNGVTDSIQNWIEQLNPRERQLLIVLSLIIAVLAIIIPAYLAFSSIAQLEAENTQINDLIHDIYHEREQLQQNHTELRNIEQLYKRKTPALGSYIERQAKEHGLSSIDVSNQPEVVNGDYTRRSVQVSLSHVPLKPFIEMLSDIKNSPHPVSIKQIQIDGGNPGQEEYLTQISVNAYDKQEATGETEQ